MLCVDVGTDSDYCLCSTKRGARGGAVGRDTALAAGRSRFDSLELVMDTILRDSTVVLGSTQALTEMSSRNIFWR